MHQYDAVGFGLGMEILPSVIAVSFYFEKRRSLATGIAVCGSGIGMFVYAPFLNALLTEYSWKGTLLIQAGILLNCIIFGSVFRPLNVSSKQHPPTAKPSIEEMPTNGVGDERPRTGVRSASDIEPPNTLTTSPVRVKRSRRFSESDKWIVLQTSSKELVGSMSQKDMFHARSLDYIPPYRVDNDDDAQTVTSMKEQPEPHSDKNLSEKIAITQEEQQRSSNVVAGGQSEIKAKSASNPDLSQTSSESPRAVERRRRFSESEKWEMSQNNEFCNGSVTFTRQCHKDSCEDVGSIASSTVWPETQSRNSLPAKIGIAKKMRQTISEIMIFKLLADTVFILVAVSSLVACIGLVVPIVFLANRGLRLGMDSSQSYWLVSAMGIANTLGRVVSGLIASINCVDRLMLYSAVRAVCGILSLFSGLLWTFPLGLQMCYAIIFGFCYGTL